MVHRRDIEALGKIKSANHCVVSLYLNLAGTKLDSKACALQLRDMINEQKQFFKQFHSKHNFKETERELDYVYKFVNSEFKKSHPKGLVIFSSQSQNLWKCISLPQGIRNMLIVDDTPYIRPLVSYLNRHIPLGVVQIDRKQAQFFGIVLGEIKSLGEIKDNVAKRVRAGGWQGYEEKKINRHVQDQIHHHFNRVSQELMIFFKKEELEGLVLIGTKKNVAEFKTFLHPFLKERWLSDLELDRSVGEKDILKQVLRLEEKWEQARQKPLLEKWTQGVEKNTMAVSGLRRTLQALSDGAVRVLLVGDSFRSQGKRCNACDLLRVDGTMCPKCNHMLEPVPDVVDEAEQLAVKQDIEIESIHGLRELDKAGGIGALLRFQK